MSISTQRVQRINHTKCEWNETKPKHSTKQSLTYTHTHTFTLSPGSFCPPPPTTQRSPFPVPREGALIQAATTSLKNPTTVESRKGNGIPLRKKKDGEWKRGEDTQPETCRRQKRRSLKTGEQNKYNSNNNSNSNCVS